MRRADENAAEASLELLLDTICNAFGGILFLTIMMALFLKISSPAIVELSVSPEDRQEMVVQEQMLEESLSTLASLKEAMALQGASEEALIAPGIAARARELRAKQASLDKTRDELFEARRKAAVTQVALDQLAVEKSQIEDEVKRLDKDMSGLSTNLQDAITRKSKNISPSRTRSTTKLEVQLVLRYGRLYLMFKKSPGSFFPSFNKDDFVFLGEEGGKMTMTVKQYRGLVIGERPSLRSEVAHLLAAYDPQNHYLGLVVWDDSFEEFGQLRDVLVDLRYDCRIIPVKAGDPITFGGVNDPQVQ